MKNLRNFLIGALTSGLLFGNSLVAQNSKYHAEKNSEKYAVIYTSADCETPIHPIDISEGLLNSVKVYDEMIKSGIKKDNIYFLSLNQEPLKKDTGISKISGELLTSKHKMYSKMENLWKVGDSIAKKINPRDTLIVYVNAHGDFNGEIYSSLDGKDIPMEQFNTFFKKIPTENKLVVLSSCFSGKFLENAKEPGVYCSSSDSLPTWGDREVDFGSIYFRELNNKENDLNKNGKVDFEEAFNSTKKIFHDKCVEKVPFMLGEYLNKANIYEKKFIPNEIKKMTFNPCIRKITKN